MTVLILVLSIVFLVASLVLLRRKERGRINSRNLLKQECVRIRAQWFESEVRNIAVTKALLIAKGALNDIANQNAGDHYYELWARKRAVDTVALIERTGLKE